MTATESAARAPWMQDVLKQGLTHLNAGEIDEASDCARRVLGAKRDLPEGHFLVGLIALELGQRWTAVQAFGSVTKLDANNGAAWAHMAKLYMQMGQPARADTALVEAVANAGGSAIVQDLIGIVHSLLGEQEEALGWHAKAVAEEPENVAFRVNFANCNMYVGKLEEAEAALRDALRMQPGNPSAHWQLAGLQKARDRVHVDEMQALIAQGRYSPQARAFLYYACGKELEDLEQWDDAFEAFDAGAKARHATIEYDEQTEIDMYAALERIYTRNWLDEGSPGHDDASPIFIVGQPRSGTTLVERVITAHSQIHSAGELRHLGNAFRRLTQYRGKSRFSAELVEQASTVDFAALGKAYIQTTRKLRGSTPHFVDKLPSNFLYLPLILKALPNAKVIHLRRNPMDACFSSFKQLFADAYPHSYDQEEMARHHARYYKLMSVWRERFSDRYYEVTYEDIASNLEPNARALIEFLGVPWEDACLDFHKQKTAVTTASAVQVRQPAHTKSIGRWRRYEQQLQAMRDVLAAHEVPVDR